MNKDILSFLRLFWSYAKRLPLYRIHTRFTDLTMVPRDSYVDNLELARMPSSVPGCIVECGVWRGGMSGGIANILGPSRKYFLLDSFEGLPPAKEVDGKTAIEWQADKSAHSYYDNCKAEESYASEAMKRAGVTDFQLIKGWFSDTVPQLKLPEPIALLRLDGDWYDSTMVCLDHLFDKVVPGGVIIIDDYFAWDGCSRAVHDFLSKRSATERLRTNGRVCYMVKA
jgi:O-methyltransferase